MPTFSHLHCHTQFSLLDGAASISSLMKKAQKDGMPAVAITDHGNMFGAFKFVAEASKYNVKPIVGCEFYVVKDRHQKHFTKESGDVRHHQLLLAKNKIGYKNLSRLCSLGFIEGYYSKYPRIDKEILLQHTEGLIATTCCIGAEIPQAILHKGEDEAEKLFQWWLDIFGEDYYIELQRHNLPEQIKVNEVLMRFAKKYNVKIIASNDSHYVNQEDFEAHDILLCVNTGEKKATPIGDGKGRRFGFPNSEFYFKTQKEMAALFHDLPEALDNTNEIVDKVEILRLKQDILLPAFPLPPEFSNGDAYLRHLTYQGAVKRYKILTVEVEERLNYELDIVEKMGFAGYFLIVSDFIQAGRDLGVMVGPGRGSAAGSAIAYCIGITNIDPIKYSLLFERFLNPERVSMPDIDTDFDDEGRQKVMDYVVEKYGKNQVAQIITYGTMAAKSAIKDVARVTDLPLDQANMLAKLVPEKPGITLQEAYEQVSELKKIRNENSAQGAVLKQAEVLEGSVRNVGIHASAVVIAPEDILNIIPVAITKDAKLNVSQFDGKVIESAGLLKMDFLGLTTLNYIKDTIAMVKKNHAVVIDIDAIPLDDAKAFTIFQNGETNGVFQFESDGMKMYMKELKPTTIEDLIAMNALYRPGPMSFIPNFIARKHGKEKVEYPHALLEPILKATYGIMVYQEQIMQTAQILAGYSLGGADLLRRAMGKKDKDAMSKESIKFVKGAGELHNIPMEKALEIFSIMEKFAEYGFNRSHAAAYSVVAYQTAYLKAHYPAEYLAAVLSKNMNNIEDITFFMEECRQLKIEVLGPNINESDIKFNVTPKGQIRFGLSAIKGFGETAAESIMEERKNGTFLDLFDFFKRVNNKALTKKPIEALATAGAFDDFTELHRATFFAENSNASTFTDTLLKYSIASQEDNDSAASLFGDSTDLDIVKPTIPTVQQWVRAEVLKKEKAILGIYLSGHPLDDYKIEYKQLARNKWIQIAQNIDSLKDKEVVLGGILSEVSSKTNKSGKTLYYATFEDYSASYTYTIFPNQYGQLAASLQEGIVVIVKGVVQKGFREDSNYEFRIKSIDPIEEIFSKQIQQIVINIPIANITNTLIDAIHSLVTNNQGKTVLKFRVPHPEDGTYIMLENAALGIQISRDLLSELDAIQGIAYRLL